MGLQDVKELLAGQGAEPRTSTPEEFASYIQSQIDVYRRIISDAGIRPE